MNSFQKSYLKSILNDARVIGVVCLGVITIASFLFQIIFIVVVCTNIWGPSAKHIHNVWFYTVEAFAALNLIGFYFYCKYDTLKKGEGIPYVQDSPPEVK